MARGGSEMCRFCSCEDIRFRSEEQCRLCLTFSKEENGGHIEKRYVYRVRRVHPLFLASLRENGYGNR